MLNISKVKDTIVIVVSILLFFLCSGQTLAFYEGTAYTELDWTSASFSGSVSPISEYSTMTEAYGWPDMRDMTNFTGTSDYPGYWEQSISAVQFGPQTYAAAEADTKLTAFATTNGYSSLTAQVERWGTITLAEGGNVSIDIPYSFMLNTINDGNPDEYAIVRTYSSIILYSYPGFSTLKTVAIDYLLNDASPVSNYSVNGLLSLSVSNLPELTDGFQYRFNVVAISQTWANPVPEPATMLLLGLGLMGLAGVGRKFKS